MADRRPEEQEMSRAKKPKTGGLDPKENPYLAHMYEPEESYNNSYISRNSNGYGSSEQTGLSGFKRHATTAAQAHIAEDGPANPLNNNPLSNRYFDILKTRRNLPVHKQRYISSASSLNAKANHSQARVLRHVPENPDPRLCW